MVWNKLKQQLESFLSPSLKTKLSYLASGYRYLPDKPMHNFIVIDKKEIFNMKDKSTNVIWYQTEQDVKNDDSIIIEVSVDEIEAIRKASNNKIPDERLAIIARDRKIATLAKDLLSAQQNLVKTDFQKVATRFLSDSIEHSLDSDDILLNVLAIIDRRVGKKRLQSMNKEMKMKHPIVQYFYQLRRTGS